MKIDKSLLAIAFFIVMTEIFLILLIINATKTKIVDSLIDTEFQRAQQIASRAAQSLEQDILATQKFLTLTAQFPEIIEENHESCNAKIDEIYPILSYKVDNLIRINESGQIYCAANRNAVGIDVLQNEEFIKLFEDPRHQATVHRLVYSPISNKYVSGLYVPVYNNSTEFVGTVGGVIYFEDIRDKYFNNFSVLKSGVFRILDDNGDILYDHKNQKNISKNLLSDSYTEQKSDPINFKNNVEEMLSSIYEDRPSFIRHHYPPDEDWLAAYYPVRVTPDHNWIIEISVPTAEVVNQLDEDSLLEGFANFSMLAVVLILIVFVTQISLFLYLLSRTQR